MKILVFSDSHGMPLYMKEALQRHRTADAAIFLGDGLRDFENLRPQFPNMAFFSVKGNCDLGLDAPVADTVTLGGKKIFYTHGHLYQVKYGLYTAVCAARQAGADLLLFGHTHTPLQDYDDGLYLLNPGAVSGYNASYGLLDISEKGILTNILHTG